MALPNKPFLINYNARDYDPSTYTIPKHPDQTLDWDCYFSYRGGSITKYDDYIHTVSCCTQYTFSSTGANPFNRDSSNKSLTIIYKTANLSNGGDNIIANRGSNYNWMASRNVFHTSNSSFLSFAPPSSAHTTVVRIQSNGTSERWVVDNKTSYYASAYSINYGSASNAFGILVGYGDSTTSEVVPSADFYWIYVSTEALTDSEIEEVIAFNDQRKSFEANPDHLDVPYSGSAYTVTLDSDLEWNITGASDFISVSPSSGVSGTTSLSVTVAPNGGFARNGAFYIVDEELDEIEVTVSQEKSPLLVPFMSMYRSGNRIT